LFGLPFGQRLRQASGAFKKLMGVLWRREILAPAMKGNRALHDLAMVGRLELQTNFAALPPAVRTGLKRRGLQEFQEFSA